MTEPIAGYNLKAPDATYAKLTFASILGEKAANILWQDACKACGVSIQCSDGQDLQAVYEHLADKDGPIGVFGMSLKIRLQAFNNLSRIKKN